MNSVEDYVKRSAKHTNKDLDTFSEWILIKMFDACD